MKKNRKEKRLKRKQKKEIIQIYPMLPIRYSPLERKKIREFEKMILSEKIEDDSQKVKKIEKIIR